MPSDPKPSRRNQGRYIRVFFAHNGPGPYPCHFGCGIPVTFDEVCIHHHDEDKNNDAPENLKASHLACHTRHHASVEGGLKMSTRLKMQTSHLGKPSGNRGKKHPGVNAGRVPWNKGLRIEAAR